MNIKQASHFLICFVLSIVIFSCGTSSSENDHYVDTPEEFIAYADYFSDRRKAIRKLPKEQYMDSITTFACEVYAKMNLDLYVGNIESIAEAHFGKDSIQYNIVTEMYTPVSWLLVGFEHRPYYPAEKIKIAKMMADKCPHLNDKFSKMDSMFFQVTLARGKYID